MSATEYIKILPLLDDDVGHPQAPHIQLQVCTNQWVGGFESGRMIDFMIDTGSAVTILSPADSKALFTPTYREKLTVRSIDGSLRISCVPFGSRIAFRTERISQDNEYLILKTDLYAAVGDDSEWGDSPSLLGRDILRFFEFIITPPSNEKGWQQGLYLMPEFAQLFKRVKSVPLSPDQVEYGPRRNLKAV